MRICLKSLCRIAKLSEHEPDGRQAQEGERLWLRFSRSFASLRHRLSHAKVLSTTHRLGTLNTGLSESLYTPIQMLEDDLLDLRKDRR
jgi:hypothetical protein